MPLLCWLLLIADPCTARAEPDVKYASAPQGTSYSLTGRTSFTGTKTEAQAPYVIGVDTDEYYTTFESGAWPGASKLITSALKKVDKAVQLSIENYVNGVASGSNFRLDASNGGVGFAPAHDASDVVTAAITVVRAVSRRIHRNGKAGGYGNGKAGWGCCCFRLTIAS